MFCYEIKKVFSRPRGKLILMLYFILLAIVCSLSVTSVRFVDEEGNTRTGPKAARMLRSLKMQWAGDLTEEVLLEVLRQNAAVNSSLEYRSDDVQENNKAYAKKQGFSDLRDLINCSFCAFREYNYYRADHVTEEEIPRFYESRISNLVAWLNSDEGDDQFSEQEKQFLIRQYEKLETPFYYEYTGGWIALLEYAPTMIMLTVLFTSFLVSGIFSSEFQWKTDAIFFSARYGRKEAVASKVIAGFCIITVIYWVNMLLYSGIVLGILGTDGADCAIQASFNYWKSFYLITFFENFLLTLCGGYIGSLFLLSLTMLVSAKTHSSVFAVTIPFLFLFLPSFAGNLPVLSDLLGLMPDQLLQVNVTLNYFNLYPVGSGVTGAVWILFVLYTLLSLLLLPALYLVYKKTEAI